MANDKLSTGPEENKSPESPTLDGPNDAPGPKHTEQAKSPATSEKVIDLAGIRTAADKEDKAPESPADDKAPWEKSLAEIEAENPPKRRGRAPKEQAGNTEKTAEPRTGRPPKTGKTARDEAPPSKRDKVSQSKKSAQGKDTAPGEAPPSKPGKTSKSGKAAPVKEVAAPVPEINLPPTPAAPPRPVEESKIVYLKLSELHPFHTFRKHPFKVVDDAKMMELVGTIKEHGVMTPGTVRPEKDGNGYEIVAGHRRQRGSELAELDEMPCIIREMTDLEAVREMRNSNKQRGDPLPSELARLLDLEVEAIKHQGAPRNTQEQEAIGKRSVEIVGAEHDMNYKKVMRYIRLNSLVPELLNMVDEKRVGFIPAVELSYIRPENQHLIAVSIEGEQSSPSLSQAKKLRELDKEGKLNGDVIDGILSQEKKEVDKVIISTAELGEFFDKTATPREMKDQILALLGEWKAKQPPELAKPEKNTDLDK